MARLRIRGLMHVAKKGFSQWQFGEQRNCSRDSRITSSVTRSAASSLLSDRMIGSCSSVSNMTKPACSADLKHCANCIGERRPCRRFHRTLRHRLLPDTCRTGLDSRANLECVRSLFTAIGVAAQRVYASNCVCGIFDIFPARNRQK